MTLRRGALLLELIFSLAIFVAGATTILLVIRNGIAGLRWAIEEQRALDQAASAIAQIEAGLRSAQELAGPIPSVRPSGIGGAFDNTLPAPTNWFLDIDTRRSELPGLVVLVVTARLDAPNRTGVVVGEPGTRSIAATLTTLVPLERAQPPEANPDDELQAIFDREALR